MDRNTDQKLIGWRILYIEEKIALFIWEYNTKPGGVIFFSKLVDLLKNEASISKINKIIDRLFDFGMIDGK